MLDRNNPVSLYIHMPWCVRKCPYCDFNSHQVVQNFPEEAYIKRLIEDFQVHQPLIANRPIHTIFIGGGTPSLFSAKSYDTLFRALSSHPFTESCEITLEANPNSIESERFKGYFQTGINRLSIGIQSFNDRHLKTLGRLHSANEAKKAIDIARNAGFTRFNLDIMHGLPDQTIEEGIADLKEAMQFMPPHLSWYQLTIEPNTLFYAKNPPLPSEYVLGEIEIEGKNLLKLHQYEQYEVSAYAQSGYACQHNMNYWEFGDYLGIGAGAHSKITNAEKMIRFSRHKHPKDYLTKPFNNPQHVLSTRTRVFEYFLNAFRLEKPLKIADILTKSQTKLSDIAPFIEKAQHEKLLEVSSSQLKKTDLGKKFTDNLISIFLDK